MSMFYDSTARELLELWALLDADGRILLLDFAKRLIEGATFIGGPIDGHPVTAEDREYPIHTFDHGQGLMAVYETDDRGRFVFVDIRPADDVANGPEPVADVEPIECPGLSPWDDDDSGVIQ